MEITEGMNSYLVTSVFASGSMNKSIIIRLATLGENVIEFTVYLALPLAAGVEVG